VIGCHEDDSEVIPPIVVKIEKLVLISETCSF